MKIVEYSKKSEMLDICECHECKNLEYYGMMIWFNGHQYCRSCTYRRWEQEGYEAAKNREIISAAKNDMEPDFDHLQYWRPTEKDYVFPIYEDGVNYYEQRT